MRQAEFSLPLLATEADGPASKEAETLRRGRAAYQCKLRELSSTFLAPELSEGS